MLSPQKIICTLSSCSVTIHDHFSLQALIWLRNNRNRFEGEVYEPLIVCGNVTDSANAVYLENTINARDLTMFFFDQASDMNLFLNEIRGGLKLERVSAAQVPARPSAAYQPQVPESQLAGCGLISYLKDMIEAPDKASGYGLAGSA
jgi:hypothetical protein